MDKDEIEEQKNFDDERISIIPILKIILDIIYIIILFYCITFLPHNFEEVENIVLQEKFEEVQMKYAIGSTIGKSFKIIIPIFIFLNILLLINEKNLKIKLIVGIVTIIEICVMIYCYMNVVIN